MDALSDVLSLLDPQSVLSVSMAAGGNWAVQFKGYDGIKFAALVSGACWLAADGLAQPIALAAGDCYLLTDGRPYRLASDLGLKPADGAEMFAHLVDGVARCGDASDENDAMLIGGRFTFDQAHAAVLLDSLPPVIHVAAASPHAAVVRWVLERLADEIAASRAGASLMADHLAHILLLQALRAHLASQEQPAIGWLGALSDPKIGHAIGLMHGEPARRWTLNGLAAAAGMSRSTFAQRFKALVGTPPLDYLLRWRMRLAGRSLRSGSRTVSAVAQAFGYASESAFSSAFKRVMGASPKHYRSAVG